MGGQVIDWCAYYLCHGPGDIQGDRLFFDDEFCDFIDDCYRLYPKGHKTPGRRVVTLAEISRAKGRAKSELAGALVCAELLGPVRFDHWAKRGEVSAWGYEFKPGEPVGAPVTYPVIRCLSTEETQAGNTYDNVRIMLEHAKAKFGGEFLRCDIARTRVLLDEGRGGDCRPCSSGAASKDGGKETFAVADEDHLYYLPELRDMFGMISRNLRKRKAAQPWLLCTTTQFEPGKGSVAEDHRRMAEELMAKKRRHYGFCWDHREGFKVNEWDNDDEVLASLEEAYGSARTWMDLDSILHDYIRAPGATRADSERYFTNRSTSGSGKAVDAAKWDALAEPSRTPTSGARIVLGFDGSEGGLDLLPDDTALVAWTVEERPHLFLVHRQFRPENHSGAWHVPKREVDLYVQETRTSFDVCRLVCDPPGWRDQIDDWSQDFGQDANKDDIVLDFPTASSVRMDPAIDRFLAALDTGAFTHDGSAELRWYALNALLVTAGGRGQHKALVKETKPQKIDGLVAAIISYHELPNIPVEKPAPTFVGTWA